MDIVNIVQSIQKMKAAINVILQCRVLDGQEVESLYTKIYDLYFKNNTIYLDKDEKEKFIKS